MNSIDKKIFRPEKFELVHDRYLLKILFDLPIKLLTNLFYNQLLKDSIKISKR